MSTYIIAKPRISENDAIDLVVGKLPTLSTLTKMFCMRAEFCGAGRGSNHDSIFRMMLSDGAEDCAHLASFKEIMASHTGGEIFAPLLTNLILSPLSSKEILAAGDDVVQAAMKVVNALLDEIVKVLPDAKLAVIFPSRAEFIKAQRTQLSLVDGYSPADAGYLAETMATIGENAVALLRAQTRISTSFVNLPSFSGPAAIMTEFGMLMEGFPVGSSIDWLSINQASQLWLSELLLAKLGPNYVERNAGARLSGQVQVNALKDAMLYNYFDTLNTANAPLSRRRNPDREEARRIDIAHLERFLWKGRS